MPLVPGAPHIALRCPVSKEPGAFPRKSVSLRREAPLLPSCGGVAVTLSGSRGIASHFPRFFPIFFPDMTGNDGFFPQKTPPHGGDSGILPPGVPGRDAPAFTHGVDGPLTPAGGVHEDCPPAPRKRGNVPPRVSRAASPTSGGSCCAPPLSIDPATPQNGIGRINLVATAFPLESLSADWFGGWNGSGFPRCSSIFVQSRK